MNIEILLLMSLCGLIGAVVTGPLFSIEARGKIADAMVFFPWKGRSVVREWKKPSNPKTTTQGDIRQTLGGLGRACSVVHTKSQYAVDAREVADTGQTWVSAFVKYCVNTWMSDSAAFEARVVDLGVHGSVVKFQNEADALALTSLFIPYRGTENGFGSAMQLFMLGCYGCNQYALNHEKFNRPPFTNTMNFWGDAQVDELVALLKTL